MGAMNSKPKFRLTFWALARRSETLLSVLLALSLVSAAWAVEPPRALFSVQVGAFTTPQEAQRLAAELGGKGIRPVAVVEEAPWFKVRVGRVEDYPTAMILKEKLGEVGLADRFIVETSNTAQLMEEPFEVPGAKPLIDCSALEPVPSRPLHDAPPEGYKGLPTPEELGMGPYVIPPVAGSVEIRQKGVPRDPDADAKVKALEARVSAAPVGSVERGYLSYWLALAKERRDGKKSDALAIMEALAKGQIPVPPGYRKLAWRQVADMAHYTYHKYFYAHRLYREMLACWAFTPDEKAELTTQLAGTYLELLDSKKGHPADVRRACAKLMEGLDAKYVRERATIDLIASETPFRERDWTRAVEEARRIQRTYANVQHVWAQAKINEMTAWWWVGGPCLGKAYQIAKEVAALGASFDLNASFKQRMYGRWNLPLRGARRAAQLAELLDDLDGRDYYNQLIEQMVQQPIPVEQTPGYGQY